MIVIVGKSGSGKSTIENELLKYGYQKVISYTTRAIRDNERNGEDYHFLSKEKFLELVESDFFAEYVTYNGNYYGSAKEDCGKKKVIVVEKNGLEQLINNNVNMISFYIKVDIEIRYKRMLDAKRGITLKDVLQRIENDGCAFLGVEQMTDYVVENIVLEDCIKNILDKSQ